MPAPPRGPRTIAPCYSVRACRHPRDTSPSRATRSHWRGRWMAEDDRLRIAMLAPIAWRTPPRHYGPWELVTSLLTEALVARGVDVTLFATRDSLTRGKLAGVCPAPYAEDATL